MVWRSNNFKDIEFLKHEALAPNLFLPKEDDSHSYVQAPYEKINNLQFKKLSDTMPTIDFSKYREVKDMTTSSQELACTGNSCEL